MPEIFVYLYRVDVVGTILIYTNVLFGLIVFSYELKEYNILQGMNLQWSWIKLAYALIGLFWLLSYLVISFLPHKLEITGLFGAVVVRPGITVTLAVMAAGAFSRRYRRS